MPSSGSSSRTCCSRGFPTHDEGYKSKVKAGIVSAASLARLAEDIELGRFVLLGRGEEKTGGRHKHAILADGFEALIAAIYLDGGIEAAREFIARGFGPLIAAGGDQAADATFTEDWKSALQEWLQANGHGLPHYRLAAAEGPDHRKRFDVEVVVGGEARGRAVGRSKKEAEQQAAREALLSVQKGNDTAIWPRRLMPAPDLQSQSISMIPDRALSSRRPISATTAARRWRATSAADAPSRTRPPRARSHRQSVARRGRRGGRSSAEQRILERVALAVRRDEVHVLEPRQVVLGRARRALEVLRDLGQVQRLGLGQHAEDRLERAVAARAMQAELVALAAARRERAVGREERRERRDRIRDRGRSMRATPAGDVTADARPPDRAVTARPATTPSPGGHRRTEAPSPALRRTSSGGMWMTSNRADASRSSRCTREVKRDARTKRDRARREPSHELALHVTKAREALERPDVEELVEQKCHRGRLAPRSRADRYRSNPSNAARGLADVASSPVDAAKRATTASTTRRQRSGVRRRGGQVEVLGVAAAERVLEAQRVATCGRCRNCRARPECARPRARPRPYVRERAVRRSPCMSPRWLE